MAAVLDILARICRMIKYFLPLSLKYLVMITSILLGIIGPWQIVLIVLVVLLLFGGKKIPELMRGLGRGVKEFKDGINPDENDKKDEGTVEKKK